MIHLPFSHPSSSIQLWFTYRSLIVHWHLLSVQLLFLLSYIRFDSFFPLFLYSTWLFIIGCPILRYLHSWTADLEGISCVFSFLWSLGRTSPLANFLLLLLTYLFPFFLSVIRNVKIYAILLILRLVRNRASTQSVRNVLVPITK